MSLSVTFSALDISIGHGRAARRIRAERPMPFAGAALILGKDMNLGSQKCTVGLSGRGGSQIHTRSQVCEINAHLGTDHNLVSEQRFYLARRC